VQPLPSPRKHWARLGIADWLCEELARAIPSVVGIDHGFSFPLAYFKKYSLSLDWPKFLDDFQQHWPTDDPSTYVEFVRDGACGHGDLRRGDKRWLRLTEQWTATAKSVFMFDVQGAVAKSTHAGLPWLRYLRQHCQRRFHFWPFDGWEVPQGKSVVAEVYPSLWTRRFPKEDRDGDEQAAFAVSAWLRRADRSDSLPWFLAPPLTEAERKIADIEGWILGGCDAACGRHEGCRAGAGVSVGAPLQLQRTLCLRALRPPSVSPDEHRPFPSCATVQTEWTSNDYSAL